MPNTAPAITGFTLTPQNPGPQDVVTIDFDVDDVDDGRTIQFDSIARDSQMAVSQPVTVVITFRDAVTVTEDPANPLPAAEGAITAGANPLQLIFTPA